MTAAARGSLALRPVDHPGRWTNRLLLVGPDGTALEAGIDLDGAGAFDLRLPGAPDRRCRLTPEWRAALRTVLMRAVDEGTPEPDPDPTLP